MASLFFFIFFSSPQITIKLHWYTQKITSLQIGLTVAMGFKSFIEKKKKIVLLCHPAGPWVSVRTGGHTSSAGCSVAIGGKRARAHKKILVTWEVSWRAAVRCAFTIQVSWQLGFFRLWNEEMNQIIDISSRVATRYHDTFFAQCCLFVFSFHTNNNIVLNSATRIATSLAFRL